VQDAERIGGDEDPEGGVEGAREIEIRGPGTERREGSSRGLDELKEHAL